MNNANLSVAFTAHLFQFEKTIKALDQNRTFFDVADFPWARKLEADWQEIRHEVDQILSALSILPGFEEIQVEQGTVTTDKRWKIFPLFVYGWLEKNRARCPATARALENIPDLQVAMFSIFQGGKELPPHRGPYAGVLRYHLGLRVPKPESQCGICVGGDSRSWMEGESMIFDDSHMHHAWNRSNEDRVVLFVDFVRPLPVHLKAPNEKILNAISDTDFVRKAADNWAAWEATYGQRLDDVLRQDVPAAVRNSALSDEAVPADQAMST